MTPPMKNDRMLTMSRLALPISKNCSKTFWRSRHADGRAVNARQNKTSISPTFSNMAQYPGGRLQAIRGAAFAVPGALGVQEGGYVLLASLVGLPSHAGLALSLGKRTREILLGLPGLLYLHLSERAGANAVRAGSR